jgi:hypothetical protein
VGTPSSNSGIVNSVEGKALEDIRVVSEFPNVFPEDLPGMSTDCDIEFSIELIPGTAPISKRPYRMDVKDIANERNKLRNYLVKGLSVLVHHHGEPPHSSLIRRMDLGGCCIDYQSLNEVTIKNKYTTSD